MATLVSSIVQDRLFEHGIKYAWVGLMAVHVEEHAFPELEAMDRCPADKAMDVALPATIKAWDAAMRAHGMFRGTIDKTMRQAQMDIEELMDERIAHIQATIKQQALTPSEDAALQAEEAELEGVLHRVRVSSADPIK
ncbi:hypothetical protein [Actinomadura sp. 6N118]|uniref:hypothetical protein n=1 Tax=Actinomadura sp. 6N118 TaxID=3375151 RepID=UPI0037883FD1